MSKSLGNVVDPLDVINGKSLPDLQERLKEGNLAPSEIETAKKGMEKLFPDGIPRAGADALRFALLRQNVKDVDINFDVATVRNSRNFGNKLWQGMNFCKIFWRQYKTPANSRRLQSANQIARMDPVNQWILSRLSHVIKAANEAMEGAELHIATQGIYEFWVKEFCDVYLEYVKPLLVFDTTNEGSAVAEILTLILNRTFRLLAPFMPFLAEEMMMQLRIIQSEESLQSVHQMTFPDYEEISFMKNDTLDKAMSESLKIVQRCRSIRAEFGISKKDRLNGFVLSSPETSEALTMFDLAIQRLGNLKIYASTEFDRQILEKENLPCFVDEKTELFLRLKDIKLEEVLKRLESQLETKNKRKDAFSAKINLWKGREGSERQKAKWTKRAAVIDQSIENLKSDIDKLELMILQLRKSG